MVRPHRADERKTFVVSFPQHQRVSPNLSIYFGADSPEPRQSPGQQTRILRLGLCRVPDPMKNRYVLACQLKKRKSFKSVHEIQVVFFSGFVL